MTIDDQKLVEQCEAGIKTLAGVDEWVRANPQAAGSSGEALLRESNRLARALRKEAATAARKMCVGVFGPSQSGKSYLISALAQDADGSLLAALGVRVKRVTRPVDSLPPAWTNWRKRPKANRGGPPSAKTT